MLTEQHRRSTGRFQCRRLELHTCASVEALRVRVAKNIDAPPHSLVLEVNGETLHPSLCRCTTALPGRSLDVRAWVDPRLSVAGLYAVLRHVTRDDHLQRFGPKSQQRLGVDLRLYAALPAELQLKVCAGWAFKRLPNPRDVGAPRKSTLDLLEHNVARNCFR